MTARRTAAAAVPLLVVAALTAAAAAKVPASRDLRLRAAELAYNLDHDDAMAAFRQAIAADPSDPANHDALASAVWLDILFRRGAVTVDHYLGGFSTANVDVKGPPPDLDAAFKREVATAIGLSERRVAAAPRDAQAHFDLGTAVGLQASYMASVEGHVLAGFRAARRSYEEEERVIDLDPRRKDAELIVGTYRYVVSTLPLPKRLMAYVAGFGGGKERGLHMVEESARSTGENRTDALFALVLLYNREQRYEDALRVLAELRRTYPRNRLVVLEQGATAARAHRAAQADATLTEGLARLAQDRRRRMPGEEALWHYRRAVARVMLRRREDALTDLRAALAPDALLWVQGRAHVELARLAAQQGDRAAAGRETKIAIDMCARARDPICVDEAKRLQ